MFNILNEEPDIDKISLYAKDPFEAKYKFLTNKRESTGLSQESKLKNMDETRDYLIGEINQDELMSKKHKKICTTLNYIEHCLVLASTITGCVSSSASVFFYWYSYSNYSFCNWIKNLCNNCKN